MMRSIRKNHRYILFFIVFSFLITGSFYFLFLQSAVIHYQYTKRNYDASLIALNEKKQLAVSDIHAQKELHRIEQQNSDFYAAIQSNQSLDQLLQLATNSAEKSGFSVIQAAPVVFKQKNNQPADDQIQLQLSGTYQCLFYFIDQLNQSAWPYILTELKIQHADQFNIQLDLRSPS